MGLDELSRKLSGRGPAELFKFFGGILASSANTENDLVIGKRLDEYVLRSIPVYEILTVAYLARRLLPFLMQ
jgi:hypothetical protein